MKRLLELGLAELCPTCKGEQMVTRYDPIIVQTVKTYCWCCKGGIVLSEAGKELGELLEFRR